MRSGISEIWKKPKTVKHQHFTPSLPPPEAQNPRLQALSLIPLSSVEERFLFLQGNGK
jgi:hypothetical protein